MELPRHQLGVPLEVGWNFHTEPMRIPLGLGRYFYNEPMGVQFGPSRDSHRDLTLGLTRIPHQSHGKSRWENHEFFRWQGSHPDPRILAQVHDTGRIFQEKN